MRTTTDFPITVTATDRDNMERQLNEAEAIARTLAMQEGRQGVLVTRHDYDSFTVTLSDAVPFGLTYEHKTVELRRLGPRSRADGANSIGSSLPVPAYAKG